MLLNVHIKNLALIDDANVDFNDNLNILTGETGAGKSIIIGALKIGMGGKLAKDLPRDPAKEALCQLVFSIEDKQVWSALNDLGIASSDDGELIITRRIVNGRTINTINDEAVTATKLKDAAALLVDMHAQHEQQTLLKKAEHQKILDKYGKQTIEPVKLKVSAAYRKYNEILSERNSIAMDESERARKAEFLKYEISEIESAKLHIGEDEELEKLYRKMVHAKDIIEAASCVYDITGYANSS
ncbi:MAG: AAA family ATPase, partial [Coprococcus sp.]